MRFLNATRQSRWYWALLLFKRKGRKCMRDSEIQSLGVLESSYSRPSPREKTKQNRRFFRMTDAQTSTDSLLTIKEIIVRKLLTALINFKMLFTDTQPNRPSSVPESIRIRSLGVSTCKPEFCKPRRNASNRFILPKGSSSLRKFERSQVQMRGISVAWESERLVKL